MTLSNQFRILAKLEPGQAKTCELNAEILERGYKALYADIFENIWDETDSETYREVADTLDLYRAFEAHKRKGGNIPESYYAEFRGFDGNHECDHYSICAFMRREQGKWAELADHPDNSHGPTVSTYRQMVREWDRLGREFDLSSEQVASIMAAATR
ncbi:uncharacterized protein YfbU (UPF0304 family) [Methylobacterium sp. BE186]|nr:uncharacterized protein YfbU (UPF0304 family) [Methylobacterium sp. BE186]